MSGSTGAQDMAFEEITHAINSLSVPRLKCASTNNVGQVLEFAHMQIYNYDLFGRGKNAK